MNLLSSSGKLGLAFLTLLMSTAGMMLGAAPIITSATNVDIYYDAENPMEMMFAYRIVAAGATAFDASGLPASVTLDRSTGWINGNRNSPGAYDIAVTASNSDGVSTAKIHLAVHPAVVGVLSSQGTFRVGQSFRVTLHYNTTVVVSGAPHLALVIGPSGAPVFKDAIYVGGSGSNELVFQYTVAAGDNDPDGVQLLPSAPTGGVITDTAGLTASPSLPVRHFVSGIMIQADTTGLATTSAAKDVAASALVNVSARMRVVEGDATRSLITGFVIAGNQAKRVLLRAIGPTLTAFGVPGALVDPVLRLYSSSGALVAENNNWTGVETSSAATAVGAFALADGARDSAVVVTLQPGAYTLMVAPNGGDGVALAEVYDADAATASGSAITNLSTRGQIDGDGNELIAGFAVHGTGVQRVLVRGIGPTLGKFGVGGVLADPALKIYHDGQLVAQNDDWSTAASEVTAANTASGAFALTAGSKDSAIVLSLAAGSYTAVLSGVGNTSGVGLVEVYQLPVN